MAKKATGLFPTDKWVLAQADTDTGPMFVRYRAHLPAEKDRKKFSMLMIVRWVPTELGETNTRARTYFDQMDEFENRIVAVSDKERDWGSCVAAISVGDTKEWRFFTPDQEAFVEGFNKALAGYGPYPLAIQAFQDPDWNALKEFQPGGGRSAV